jgi:CBS-domain-containing membrane protein
VLLHARVGFVLMPILSGSLLLVVLAVLFSRLQRPLATYPHHWL